MDVTPCSVVKCTDALEDRATSIIRVDKEAARTRKTLRAYLTV